MKITVFGSGYVGLVTGTCFAEMGNHVVCIDIDQERVKKLNLGLCPLFEPGLPELLKKNLEERRLIFSHDAKMGVSHGEIIFIAVGTPPGEDGSADLKYVLAVAKTIGEYLDQDFNNKNKLKIIVNKSTVPVGTADLVNLEIEKVLKAKNLKINYSVLSNPEFLKEGAAVSDCMRPDRIVIGSNNPEASQIIKELYGPFNRNHDKLILMDVRSAELTKYAANAMLATKISFMNEMSRIAEKLGADIEQVRRGIGSDSRIGYSFIYPGCGYGGSCFPKDVQALIHMSSQAGEESSILKSVHQVNETQKLKLLEKINFYFKNNLVGKTFGIWGLAFKPNTDDIREAPAEILIRNLIKQGAKVQAYDPEAMDNMREIFKSEELAGKISFKARAEEVLDQADALIIVTEWMMFRSPDFDLIKNKLKNPVIFDGRNLYDLNYLNSLGISYYAIGRPVLGI